MSNVEDDSEWKDFYFEDEMQDLEGHHTCKKCKQRFGDCKLSPSIKAFPAPESSRS